MKRLDDVLRISLKAERDSAGIEAAIPDIDPSRNIVAFAVVPENQTTPMEFREIMSASVVELINGDRIWLSIPLQRIGEGGRSDTPLDIRGAGLSFKQRSGDRVKFRFSRKINIIRAVDFAVVFTISSGTFSPIPKAPPGCTPIPGFFKDQAR